MTEWSSGTGALARILYRDGAAVGMVDSPEIAAEIVEAMNRVGALTAFQAGQRERLLDARESGRERSLDLVGEKGPEPHALCGACGRLIPLDGGGLFMPHTIKPDDPTGDWCQRSRRRP